jgi:hypothetical protein
VQQSRLAPPAAMLFSAHPTMYDQPSGVAVLHEKPPVVRAHLWLVR